jgi:hypothetical protein
MRDILENIYIGIVGLCKAIMYFIPHFKTEELIVVFDDGVERTGTISGICFIGFVIRGVLTFDGEG